MSEDIKMPMQEGESAGEFWYGLLVNPAIASHIWNGRVWQPLLTDEDILNAKVDALRAQNGELLDVMRSIVDAWDWWQIDTYDREAPGAFIEDARAAIAKAGEDKEAAKPRMEQGDNDR